MNLCYMQLRQLTNEERVRNGLKLDPKTPRLDLISMSGWWPAIELLKSKKGMVFFNVIESRGTIDSIESRRSTYWLQCSSIPAPIDNFNFSSIYTLSNRLNGQMIGHGCPSPDQYLEPKKGKNGQMIERPNPLYSYRLDGFLFIVQPDYSMLEIVIVPSSKYSIETTAQKLLAGYMDEELDALRHAAIPFFQY